MYECTVESRESIFWVPSSLPHRYLIKANIRHGLAKLHPVHGRQKLRRGTGGRIPPYSQIRGCPPNIFGSWLRCFVFSPLRGFANLSFGAALVKCVHEIDRQCYFHRPDHSLPIRVPPSPVIASPGSSLVKIPWRRPWSCAMHRNKGDVSYLGSLFRLKRIWRIRKLLTPKSTYIFHRWRKKQTPTDARLCWIEK